MKRPLDWSAYFSLQRKRVDAALDQFLRDSRDLPPEIHEAMRYSVFAGGKRLRPLLCLMAAELCVSKRGAASSDVARRVMPSACALELLHTYSLIHDDLPALDNDDFRRGRPTSHKKFGEAMAILTGDALLTQAFELLARNAQVSGVRSEAVVKVIETVSRAAGTLGMIGGQVVDIRMSSATGTKTSKQGRRILDYIHSHKTGALIQASLLSGALLCDGSPTMIRALSRYGAGIGLAFQIVDDVLDIIGDKKLLGKRGSDRDNGKLTFPALYGLEASQIKARREIDKAKSAVAPFGPRAAMFLELADFIINRQN